MKHELMRAGKKVLPLVVSFGIIAVLGVTLVRLWNAEQLARGGTPMSGSIAKNMATPTPYTNSTGVYCVTRGATGPAQALFIPNKYDDEFTRFKLVAANFGVSVVTAPTAGSNWVAGSCCGCNTRCGTVANGTCGTQSSSVSDGGCTSGCIPSGCCTSCGSGYMCQYDGTKGCYTMCCTGGGCPSYYCSTQCGGNSNYSGSGSSCLCSCGVSCAGSTCGYC